MGMGKEGIVGIKFFMEKSLVNIRKILEGC